MPATLLLRHAAAVVPLLAEIAQSSCKDSYFSRKNNPAPILSTTYLGLSEPIRVNQSQSELIRAYQVRSGFLRLIPIGSDKFRYPQTNIPLAPNHPLPHCNAPTPLPQRIFVCQPTHEPSHVRAPLLTPNHTYASTAAHLRLTSHARTVPRLRTFTYPNHTYASTAAHLHPTTCAGATSYQRTSAPFSTERAKQLYGGDGGFLPY